MADEKNGVGAPVLSDEEVNAAMAEAFDSGEPAESEATEIVESPAEPEAKAKTKPEEPTKGSDEARISREKLQEQNREIGNLKRDLAEIKELLKNQVVKTAKQEEAKDESVELLGEVQRLVTSGSADAETAQVLERIIKSLSKPKADPTLAKEQLQEVLSDLHEVKAERAFNSQYPSLAGQWSKLSERAWQYANEELGESASAERRQAAADFALSRLAKTLSSSRKKPAADESTNTDNTVKMKPAGSTKGAQTIQKSSAAPAKDDLSKLTDDEIEEMAAKNLNGDR